MAGMSMQQQIASQRARRSLRPNPLPTRSINVFHRRENPLRPNVRPQAVRSNVAARQSNPRIAIGGGGGGWGGWGGWGWPGFYPWWGSPYSPYTRAVVAAPVYYRSRAVQPLRPHPSVVLAQSLAASPWGGWYRTPYRRQVYYAAPVVY